jgi:hypothetical protein
MWVWFLSWLWLLLHQQGLIVEVDATEEFLNTYWKTGRLMLEYPGVQIVARSSATVHPVHCHLVISGALHEKIVESAPLVSIHAPHGCKKML